MAESPVPATGSDEHDRRPPSPIVLVDDDLDFQCWFRTVLSSLDEPVFTFGTGEDALEFLEDTQAAVAVVDVEMPGMNGFELAEKIRAVSPDHHLPIIFLSAVRQAPENVDTGYSLQAIDYLFKPCSPAILRAKVEALVELHKRGLELLRREAAVAQDEKLETLGRLAVKVAHEVNNPLQILGANMEYLRGELERLLSGLDVSQTSGGEAGEPERGQGMMRALDSNARGIERIARAVNDMRVFIRNEMGGGVRVQGETPARDSQGDRMDSDIPVVSTAREKTRDRALSAPGHGVVAPEQEKPTLLCVDDEDMILESICRQLATEFEIEVASSATKALELLETKGPFAIVLTDANMPVMNGAELLARIRAAHPQTICMMMTGDTSPGSVADKARNRGLVRHVFGKPFPFNDFRTAARAMLPRSATPPDSNSDLR